MPPLSQEAPLRRRVPLRPAPAGLLPLSAPLVVPVAAPFRLAPTYMQ
jgi:hypothetical protein